LKPRFLLDTHIVVRWLSDPRRLSREQTRVLEDVARTGEPIALSGITLLEIAVVFGSGRHRMRSTPAELLSTLDANPAFQVLPITVDIATEVATMGGSLSDPADRAIVATARVHRLRLITADRRVVESHLVPVVE
jgi:PIN domain nuclease of toxin-antitoxin system